MNSNLLNDNTDGIPMLVDVGGTNNGGGAGAGGGGGPGGANDIINHDGIVNLEDPDGEDPDDEDPNALGGLEDDDEALDDKALDDLEEVDEEEESEDGDDEGEDLDDLEEVEEDDGFDDGFEDGGEAPPDGGRAPAPAENRYSSAASVFSTLTFRNLAGSMVAGVGTAAQSLLRLPDWWSPPVDATLPPSLQLVTLACLNNTDLTAAVKDHRKNIKGLKKKEREGHDRIDRLSKTNLTNDRRIRKMEGAINVLNDRKKANITSIDEQAAVIKKSHTQMNKSEVIATTGQKLLNNQMDTFQYMELPKVHKLLNLDTDEKWKNIKVKTLKSKLSGCNRLQLYKNPMIAYNRGTAIRDTVGRIKIPSSGAWRRESKEEFIAHAQAAVGYISPSASAAEDLPSLPTARSNVSGSNVSGSKRKASPMNIFQAQQILVGMNLTQFDAIQTSLKEGQVSLELQPALEGIDGFFDLLGFLADLKEDDLKKILASSRSIVESSSSAKHEGPAFKKPRIG